MDINQLTHKIIGAAMQVHRVLGNGFQEVIYQRALAVEFNHIGISYEREKEMNIFYRNEQVGTRRVDFFVEDAVMVELKAVSELEDTHKAQAINYLEAYGIANGLLINFGKTSLEFKRVYNKKLVNVSTGFKGLKDEQDSKNHLKSNNPVHPENQNNRAQDNINPVNPSIL